MDRKQIYKLVKKLDEVTISVPEKNALLDWYRNVANEESEYPDNEHAVRLRMLMRLQGEAQFVHNSNVAGYISVSPPPHLSYWLYRSEVISCSSLKRVNSKPHNL